MREETTNRIEGVKPGEQPGNSRGTETSVPMEEIARMIGSAVEKFTRSRNSLAFQSSLAGSALNIATWMMHRNRIARTWTLCAPLCSRAKRA